jgi:hypothetical protein
LEKIFFKNHNFGPRSLAAYSAASSTLGRDALATGYRYPYATEPIQQGYGRMGYVPGPQEADRPNPFAGPLSPDADSVVQVSILSISASAGQIFVIHCCPNNRKLKKNYSSIVAEISTKSVSLNFIK